MSLLTDIIGAVERVAEKIANFVNSIIDWTQTPEGKAVTEVCVDIITCIVKILNLINPTKMTGDEKREAARTIARFVQAAPPEVLNRMAELNARGDLDKLTYSQLDALIGSVIAFNVEEEYQARRSGRDGRKPT